MFEMTEMSDPQERSNICNGVLRALPEWFGVESSIIDYNERVRTMPFCAAFDSNKAIGFAAVKVCDSDSSEICVMGVLKEYHRRGIGRMLMAWCEEQCTRNRTKILTVRTLDDSVDDENYERTRLFYLSVGFRPVKVIPLFWNADNPCLVMEKTVL